MRLPISLHLVIAKQTFIYGIQLNTTSYFNKNASKNTSLAIQANSCTDRNGAIYAPYMELLFCLWVREN